MYYLFIIQADNGVLVELYDLIKKMIFLLTTK